MRPAHSPESRVGIASIILELVPEKKSIGKLRKYAIKTLFHHHHLQNWDIYVFNRILRGSGENC